MSLREEQQRLSRRDILTRMGYGLGAAALHALGEDGAAAPRFPNFTPKAKRVIFMFQSGGPSHVDLFDVAVVVIKS